MANEVLLAELIACLLTGNHSSSDGEPVDENETVIGELTDTEKALFSTLALLHEKAQSIAKFNNQTIEESKVKGEEINKTQALLNKAECNAIVKMGEGLKAVMWFSIQKRIGDPVYENDGIEIKKGCKIVTFETEFDDFTEMLKNTFGLHD